MAKRNKTRANLRDDMLNPGVGLFVDERAQSSAERAYVCAIRLLGEGGLADNNYDGLQKHLLEAARHYWADFDYDDRTSGVTLKAEISAFRRALTKVSTLADKLSADARAALRAELRNSMRGVSNDPIECLKHQIITVQGICEPIAFVRGKKGPRAKDSVVRCCARLWKIRERLSDRPFAKSLDPEFDKRGIETGRFARPDAQFVFAVLQAMDKQVTFSKVRDALDSHGPSPSRRK